MRDLVIAVASLSLLALAACPDGGQVQPPVAGDADTADTDGVATPDADVAVAPDTGSDLGVPDMGLPDTGLPDTGVPDGVDGAEYVTLQAGPFTVEPGAEKYLCFTETLTEAVTVNQVHLASQQVVHHAAVSSLSSPEPDGVGECEVLFKNNWVPIFVAGTGDATLDTPPGTGFVFAAGTQITTQLHLLNTTPTAVTATIPIRLRKVQPPVAPVRVAVFGTTGINLPAAQASEVIGTCSSDSSMTIFSAFPHMHLLGRKMSVSVGPSDDQLVEVFNRDPYDFDQQSFEAVDVTINQGDRVRITCGFDNHLNQAVSYGESTTNEMCFWIGFSLGSDSNGPFPGCIQ